MSASARSPLQARVLALKSLQTARLGDVASFPPRTQGIENDLFQHYCASRANLRRIHSLCHLLPTGNRLTRRSQR